MLVQCPECSTKYDLDEDKLDHGGTKVRCKRCQHVFTAFRPMSSADILLDDPVPVPESHAPSDPDSAQGEELELERLLSKARERQAAAAGQEDKVGKEEMIADLQGAFQPPLLGQDSGETAAKPKSKAPLLVLLVLLAILCALLAGVYFLKPELLGLPSRGAEPPARPEAGAVEGAAQIALENVRQYFVPNEKDGQLFIIEGKAVNNFPEPRELIRLKATLYDRQGGAVTSQEFTCGNVVTLYQLQVSARKNIEEELSAKVGILAHNTNVQPGASVPFMVVFFGTPDSVEEFGLEVIQSSAP